MILTKPERRTMREAIALAREGGLSVVGTPEGARCLRLADALRAISGRLNHDETVVVSQPDWRLIEKLKSIHERDAALWDSHHKHFGHPPSDPFGHKVLASLLGRLLDSQPTTTQPTGGE